MSEKAKFVAFDLGAASGRGVLGTLDSDKLVLQEVHRFAQYLILLVFTSIADSLGAKPKNLLLLKLKLLLKIWTLLLKYCIMRKQLIPD